jgi:hypothetical protein
MKMKTDTVLIFAVGIGLIFGPHAFAQTTPCPPGTGGSQRPPSGKTTQSKSSSAQAPSNKNPPAKNTSAQHQAGRRGYHDHSHGGVGVGIGVNVDLGGIGQRRAEADPFAISSKTTLPPKTASGEEKVRSDKRPHHKSSDDDLWSQINPIAKEIPEPRSAVTDDPKPGRPQ